MCSAILAWLLQGVLCPGRRRGPGGPGCGAATDDGFPVCLKCGQDVGLTQRM